MAADQTLDRVDFYILNSLAEDFESILQIEPGVKKECFSALQEDIINRLLILVEKKLVQVDSDLPLTKTNLLLDLVKYDHEFSGF